MRKPLADPRPLIRRVYAYAAYRVGAGPDAEDVTSETFERALRYRDSFDPNRGDPVAWLIGIARRCIADLAMKRETATAELPERAFEGQDDASLDRLALRGAGAQRGGRSRAGGALRYGAGPTA